MTDHPDHEQLAAFQAGCGDRRQRTGVEAHLAGCPSCAAVVASVEQARRHLALLEEPSLPPGLHQRLTAAIDHESTAAAEAGEVEGQPAVRPRWRRTAAGPGSTRPDQRSATAPAHRSAENGRAGAPVPVLGPAPWYRRPVAWGAAAALLLAALIVPLLDQTGGDLDTAAGGGGGDAAQESAAAGAGQLPLIRIPGEVSAATVRSRLDADTRAKAALDAAGGGGQTATARDSLGAPGAPQDSGQGFRSSASTPPAAQRAHLPACLLAAAAAADPATRPLVPAFYIDGSYQGRPATILVTTSTAQPGRVDLWVFPPDDCSSPPLATERVR